MNPRNVHPIDYFNQWFAEPIVVTDNSVAGIVDALNRHPLARDETAQDYVMPARRHRARAGRFRIFGENQDGFFCFVYAGQEARTDPPVYFESCLDLEIDYGFTRSDILDNDHVLICSRFTDFLWHILGHHICIRMESSGLFADGVNGIVCDHEIALDDRFVNPMGREFPAGYTCFFRENVICAPDWGAAFLDVASCDAFVRDYAPAVSRRWP